LLNIYGEPDVMLTLTVTAQVQMITNGRNWHCRFAAHQENVSTLTRSRSCLLPS